MLEQQLTKGPEKMTPLDVIEIIFNSINHIFIGTITIYLTFFAYGRKFNSKIIQHMYLSTIGYQLLMAEGMLSLYSRNTWSHFFTKKTQTGLHLALQVVGSAFAIAGFAIIYGNNEKHFYTIHGITGFVSFIFLLITFVNGATALYSTELKKYIKPVYSKFFHNCMALITFVIGMVSLIYGYDKGTFRTVEPYVVKSLKVGAGLTIVLSLVGALPTMYGQIKGILRR